VAGEDLRKLQRDALAALAQRRALAGAGALPGAELSTPADSVSAPAGAGQQYLIFTLKEREFAVKAEIVQGVDRLIDLTPVPNVAPWVKGVTNLHGSIISVVDLRTFLGLEPLHYGTRTRLVALHSHEMMISVVVDSVSEMLPIPTSAISNGIRQSAIPLWATPYSTGWASIERRVVVVLDVARLLFSEKMQHYQIQSVP
jgi:purine-binding chemotaxis protein CheW